MAMIDVFRMFTMKTAFPRLILFLASLELCMSEEVFYTDSGNLTNVVLTRVVHTKYGALRGFLSTPLGKNLETVEVYLGIPYASPPVSALRFMPPVTPSHWGGVRPVIRFSAVCPQKLPNISNEAEALKTMPAGRLEYLKRLLPHLQEQSEDCLYLNLYAPKYRGRDAPKVPVMVYIHGESFEWNAGNPYDGSVLASFGNVIVVTVNYRLGVLGFLPAAEGSARGNYGLMDQFAALHWIQENIAEFGGDPKNVTVFGQGHGAACVNFLVLSPMAKGLFHRAIMQSGSALSTWAIAHDATTYGQQIARTLGCPTTQSASFLDCMRQRSVSDILKVQISVPDFLTSFGPTVDGIVIEEEPVRLMEKFPDDPQYGSFDLMFGVTRVESYFYISAHEERYGIDTDRRDRLLRTLVRNTFYYHLQEIFLTIVNEYTDWTRPIQHAINVLDGTLDAIGDALVVAPAVRSANYHSIGSHKTYFYVFGYQTEDGDFPQRQGCVHGEDLQYVFGAPLVGTLSHFSRNYTRTEIGLAEAVMSNWVNFARYGDPNSPVIEMDTGVDKPKGRFEKIVWPQYENVHQKYLMIGMKPKVRDHYHAHRLSFWLNLFPLLHISNPINLAPEHHLLEDHNNKHSYDGVVRHVPFANSNSSKTYVAAPPNPTVAGTWNGTRNRPNVLLNSLRPTNHQHGGGDRVLPTTVINITDSLAVVMHQSTFSTALSVTIAVGCSLLILNIVIFAAIYYQRDKNRQEEKMQKRNYTRSSGDGQMMQSSTPQTKQVPLRAPPPSPVCQTIQQQHQQQELALHPPPHPHHHHLHHQVHHPGGMLHPKVPPKPCVIPAPPQIFSKDSGGGGVNITTTSIAEAQPLLSQQNSMTTTNNRTSCSQHHPQGGGVQIMQHSMQSQQHPHDMNL